MSLMISGLVNKVSFHLLQPGVTLYKGDRYDDGSVSRSSYGVVVYFSRSVVVLAE